MANDIVNHPPHYTFGRFEVIDVIEDWKLGYHLGNAVKYIARADHKGKQAEKPAKRRGAGRPCRPAPRLALPLARPQALLT